MAGGVLTGQTMQTDIIALIIIKDDSGLLVQ